MQTSKQANKQTGIQAGDGGFQLKVKGHTDLTGAVIASSEQAVQDRLNWLETGTLMVRDIENYSKYKASSSGLVASVGFGIGSRALQAMARGDGFSGPQPAQEFLKAWAMTVLTGGGVINTTARGLTLVVGGAVSGGSNVVYQISIKELNELSFTDASIATAVGALTQGKGLIGTVGANMGGAYVGSQIKGEDATAPVIGAGTGAVVGSSAGKYFGKKAKVVLPDKAAEVLGNITGNLAAEAAADTGEIMLKASDK